MNSFGASLMRQQATFYFTAHDKPFVCFWFSPAGKAVWRIIGSVSSSSDTVLLPGRLTLLQAFIGNKAVDESLLKECKYLALTVLFMWGSHVSWKWPTEAFESRPLEKYVVYVWLLLLFLFFGKWLKLLRRNLCHLFLTSLCTWKL